jgi:Helicase conserved C-terminal domain
MDCESILNGENLKVPDLERQEQHLQFVESFYDRVRSHLTGTSDYRKQVTGPTEPRRLFPTAYLSPTPLAAGVPVSSRQVNDFRPSNCGLAINLASGADRDKAIGLTVSFSVFLPEIDLEKIKQGSLRCLWRRRDIQAFCEFSLGDLEKDPSCLDGLNQDIESQITLLVQHHQENSLAWMLGLDRTLDGLLDGLDENIASLASESEYQKLQEFLASKTNHQPAQVAAIDFKVTVEAKFALAQNRLRLYLRNRSQQRDDSKFSDPRDWGLFGAHIEATLPKDLWEPVTLSRFQISYQMDSTIPAQGINCTPGFSAENDTVRIWTEFLPIYWQKRSYSAGFEAPFESLADGSSDRDLNVLKEIQQSMIIYQRHWEKLIALEKWGDHTDQATYDLEKFKVEVARFTYGITILENPRYGILRRAFNLMNRTFANVDEDRASRGKNKFLSWRPFQIVFVVSNLAALAARQWLNDFIKEPMAQVDYAAVVHFATGGGKSESVMGLILTQAFFDRLRGRDWGVVAWLRYPLRLLTYQQLQRFLDMVAAADEVRAKEPILSSTKSFTVGYYGGRDNSPNSLKNLPDEARRYERQARQKMQLSGLTVPRYLTLAQVGYYVPEAIQGYRMVMRCPYCSTEKIHVYIDPGTWELRHRCGSLDSSSDSIGKVCGRDIPLFVVDEDVYSIVPTLIIGTLDKIANITFRPASRTLFGAVSHQCTVHGWVANGSCHKHDSVGGCTRRQLKVLPQKPVDPGIPLVFQDELHLLREELGTFDGHYEALVDAIHRESGGLRPKILAATATIEGAAQQIKHLYWRELSQFPVRGPATGRSFYADTHDRFVTRGFVGIRPTSMNSLDAAMAVIQALRTELEILRTDPSQYKEDYGLRAITVEAFLKLVDEHELCCTYVSSKNDGSDIRRSINEQVRGTLREEFGEEKANAILPDAITLSGDDSIEAVKETLRRMEMPQKDLDLEDPARLTDVVATSIISHGVDVDRLNLMLFYGWPNTTAEYIQASSRAGRMVPGLVFVLFRPQRARERAIFDYFAKAHEYLEQMVEAVPIDRFAHRALYRTAFGLLLGRLLHIDGPNASTERQLQDIAQLDNLSKVQELMDRMGPHEMKAVVERIRGTLNPDGFAEGQVFDEPLSTLLDAFCSQVRLIVQDPNELKHVTSGLTKADIPHGFRLLLSLRDVDPGIDINAY